MSQELAKRFGFKIGEKVLYSHYHPYVVLMDIVTIKDIRPIFESEDDSEIVADVEEFAGYISLSQIYSKKMLDEMFGINETQEDVIDEKDTL
jgi:hypothetical protein